MDTVIADIRLALRTLTRNPGFTMVAVLTLALGMGANAAVFSVVNAALIEPLPYADPDRLVAVFETAERAGVERRAISYPNFVDWRRQVRSVERLSVVSGEGLTLQIDGRAERVRGELVSDTYFDLLGARPARGRGFTAADDAPGAAAVAVISDGFWRRVFGGDPQALGRRLTIEGVPATVIGVMPEQFAGMIDDPVVWVPAARFVGPAVDDREQRQIDVVVGRLAPGVGIEEARAEIAAVAARIDAMYPTPTGRRGAGLEPLRDEFFGPPLRRLLLLMLGAVSFVLLIACVNVAGLLLARGVARQGELAVRGALGASRWRIVRQLLTESMVLALIGGAAGLLVAFWTVDLLLTVNPVELPAFTRVDLDMRVLAVTGAACIGAGILCGLMPALSISHGRLAGVLHLAGRDAGHAATTVRRGLVAAQVALAVVLLVGAALMLRTLNELRTVDPGFRPVGLVTMRLTFPRQSPGPAELERLSVFGRTLRRDIQALPGVTSASLSSDVPMGTSTTATRLTLPGRDEVIRVYRHAVSPGHFGTIGARLLAGRDFADADRITDGTRAAIVSRTLAVRHWPEGSALGQRFEMNDREYEVVGVVGDLQHRRLLEPDSADPDVYIPFYQVPSYAFAVLARTDAETEPLVAAIRQTVTRADPAVPTFQVETGDQIMGRQTAVARFSGALLAAFALVALTLTVIGIYGVTAYSVGRQTRQFGLRIALGATPGDVLWLVLSRGALFIAAGLVVGTLGALSLTRLLTAMVYGVSPTDPLTFAAAIGLLAVVALAACLVPAAKAARIDPLAALRSE